MPVFIFKIAPWVLLAAAGAAVAYYAARRDDTPLALRPRPAPPPDPGVLAFAAAADPDNRTAVAVFQKAVRLPQTGVIDPPTRAALIRYGVPEQSLPSTTEQDVATGLAIGTGIAQQLPNILHTLGDIFGGDDTPAPPTPRPSGGAPYEGGSDYAGLYNWTPEILADTAQNNPDFLEYLLSSGQISPAQFQRAHAEA